MTEKGIGKGQGEVLRRKEGENTERKTEETQSTCIHHKLSITSCLQVLILISAFIVIVSFNYLAVVR